VASQASVEIFESAVTARGRILRVEADRDDGLPRILALTFDIGRIVVRPADGEILVDAVADRAELPGGLVPLDEEDPWWRVLGHPITAVWPVGGEERDAESIAPTGSLHAVKLRFRESDANPRIVGISSAGPALRVTLEGN
jgi:hypothetical protein